MMAIRCLVVEQSQFVQVRLKLHAPAGFSAGLSKLRENNLKSLILYSITPLMAWYIIFSSVCPSSCPSVGPLVYLSYMVQFLKSRILKKFLSCVIDFCLSCCEVVAHIRPLYSLSPDYHRLLQID